MLRICVAFLLVAGALAGGAEAQPPSVQIPALVEWVKSTGLAARMNAELAEPLGLDSSIPVKRKTFNIPGRSGIVAVEVGEMEGQTFVVLGRKEDKFAFAWRVDMTGRPKVLVYVSQQGDIKPVAADRYAAWLRQEFEILAYYRRQARL